MDNETIIKIANTLDKARSDAQGIAQFKDIYPDIAQADAYSIQELGIQKRLESGEKIIAYKMGLTSKAKREQMNLHSSLYGVLTDKMEISNNGLFSLKGSIHPKIEPEIAFYIEKELEGVVTREQVLDSCSGVCAALEILDSRYEQFKYFSMEEVISDNSSSSHFVLGEKHTDFKNLDLVNLKMEMRVNTEIAQSGNSKAISDDPVLSVVELCELLSLRGKKLEAGMIVLAGAATPAVALETGMDIGLEVQGLKNVKVSVE